jgi:ribosomal 30S subunit maturation factor RimM
VVLGRVKTARRAGWAKVSSYTEPAAGIADYRQWTLVHGAVPAGPGRKPKLAGNRGATRRTTPYEQAADGAEVRWTAPCCRPGPREYYLHDLLGLSVNREASSWARGRVSKCRRTPCGVAGQGRWLVMVPERLVAVDLAAGQVTVDWHQDD